MIDDRIDFLSEENFEKVKKVEITNPLSNHFGETLYANAKIHSLGKTWFRCTSGLGVQNAKDLSLWFGDDELEFIN